MWRLIESCNLPGLLLVRCLLESTSTPESSSPQFFTCHLLLITPCINSSNIRLPSVSTLLYTYLPGICISADVNPGASLPGIEVFLCYIIYRIILLFVRKLTESTFPPAASLTGISYPPVARHLGIYMHVPSSSSASGLSTNVRHLFLRYLTES